MQTTNSDREIVRHEHLRESDEFYELTLEGRKALPQSLTHWVKNSKFAPKVRKTFNRADGTLKQQIVKTRIADLEVYNPNTVFDYRISLSLETKWNGEPHHLSGATDAGHDRQKDRLSYRHMFNQIDLTQITYPGSTRKEHELEVEIGELKIKQELELLRNRQESTYEDLIKTFVDNVRILCRNGIAT
jgi:mRNA capping enzyme, beta chain